MPLLPKGSGGSIMVSDFISEVCGSLTHTREDGIKLAARVIIRPGKMYDGYWLGENMAKQLEKAMAIHDEAYPDYDALWGFDNSCNHCCFAHDALRVERMNLGSGGKQGLLKDTFFNGQPQVMVFPPDHPDEELRGKPKGMKQVLLERGLWKENLIKTCGRCKKGTKDPEQLQCCAQRILELQPDFMAQKSLLVETVGKKKGHKIIFYPKFHCEFNFIEMFWGRAKVYTRQNFDYTFAGLQKTVPLALDSVDLKVIRRFARKSFRYMDAYRAGLSGKEIEEQVKKHKSHRRIPITNEILA